MTKIKGKGIRAGEITKTLAMPCNEKQSLQGNEHFLHVLHPSLALGPLFRNLLSETLLVEDPSRLA